MRILYYSDIHLESRKHHTRISWTETYPLDLGPSLKQHRGQVDLAVLAGDIGSWKAGEDCYALTYARQVCEYLGCPVVFVPGNHEHHYGVFERTRDQFLSAEVPGVQVLDRACASFTIGSAELRVLGATLWTDYALTGSRDEAMQEASRRLLDRKRTRRADGSCWLPYDALQEHEKSRAWLMERLDEPHNGPTLVVSHHVPHPAARNPRYPLDNTMCSFVSDLEEVIVKARAAGTVAWIFGHNHLNGAFEVEGLPLLTAQFGQPHERLEWRGPGILELGPEAKRAAA